jgi:hypothetical protein
MTHWEMASVMRRRGAPAQQSDPAHGDPHAGWMTGPDGGRNG